MAYCLINLIAAALGLIVILMILIVAVNRVIAKRRRSINIRKGQALMQKPLTKFVILRNGRILIFTIKYVNKHVQYDE